MCADLNDNEWLNNLLTEAPLMTTTSATANLFSATTNSPASQNNQQLRLDEEFSTNGAFDIMNDTEEQFDSLKNNEFPRYTTDGNESNENTQTSDENGNADANQQENGHANFCNWYLGQLQNQVNRLNGYLPQHVLPEHQKFMQDCERSPQNLIIPEGINMLLSIIEYGFRISQNVSQDSDVGKETNEMLVACQLSPAAESEDHTADEIRTITQSNPPVSSTPENDSLPKPTPILSELLLAEKEIIQGNVLIELTFLRPPKRFWRVRTMKCLFNNQCPPLQSSKERQLIVLECSNLANFNENDLYILVKLLDCYNETQPEKLIVPPDTIVEDLNNQLLRINEAYGCNLMDKTIIFPLAKVKHPDNANQIVLPVFMFNPFKPKSEFEQPHVSNLDEIDLNFVKDEILKICKLRIGMCRLTNTEQLECICQYVDTSFIKESKGTKELQVEPVNGSLIAPMKPCECGREDITILLNTNSEKAGFIVMINDERLKIHEFNGVNRNNLTIHPPPKTFQANNFHLMIGKINVLKTIELERNPYDRGDVVIDTLLDTNVEYTNPNERCAHVNQHKKSKKQ